MEKSERWWAILHLIYAYNGRDAGQGSDATELVNQIVALFEPQEVEDDHVQRSNR